MGFLFSRTGMYVAAALVIVAAVGWLRWDAVSDERKRRDALDAKHNIETRQRIDDAIRDPRTPDDIRERLRRLAE